MMRALLPLLAIVLASANDAQCALHGAEAVDELLDSAVYIWASVKRCGQSGETLRCEVDITSAIESVNGMINVILKAVHNCGGLEHAKCGLAAGVMTKSFAGLAAASGGIVAKCPNNWHPAGPTQTLRGEFQTIAAYQGADDDADKMGVTQDFGRCLVDVKGSMKSVFKAIKRMMTVRHNCKDGKSHCIHNSLKIVAAFASVGEYLAGAVGDCSHGVNTDAECASQALRLVNQVNNVAKASTAMAKDCHESSDSRLYLLDEEEEGTTKKDKDSSSSVTLALAALLPFTAVLSFVGGSRLAKARSQPARDCESLMTEDIVE